MAKPPVFDRDTWQRQKDLLAGAEEHDRVKSEWRFLGHGALFIIGALLAVGGIFGLILSVFR